LKEAKKILVSACLYGGPPCRYDGGEAPCLHQRFLEWKAQGRLVPVCPEVSGGLPVPRPAAERCGARVLNAAGADVTDAFARGAAEALRLAREHDVCFCVLKERSPSCGAHAVYDGTFSGAQIPGRGVTAEALAAAGFAVYSEEDVPEIEG